MQSQFHFSVSNAEIGVARGGPWIDSLTPYYS
jgi:hypothetical protein